MSVDALCVVERSDKYSATASEVAGNDGQRMRTAPPGEVVPVGTIRLDGVRCLRVGERIYFGLIFDPAEKSDFVAGGSDGHQISRSRILTCHGSHTLPLSTPRKALSIVN